MDAMSILIGLAVCIVAAVVLYFISLHSFKEKTYEEVLAEQKKFADSLLTTKEAKAAAKEKEKKQKKPAKKQPKSLHPPTLSSQVSEEKPHVEFEPDAEIIPEDLPVALPKEKENKKKGDNKKDKVKPILRHRDQPVAPESFDPDVDSINHFADHPPKDDLELTKVRETVKAGGKAGGGKQPKQPVVEEKFVATEVPVEEPIVVKETAFTCGPAAPVVIPAVQPSTPVKKPSRKKNVKGDSVEVVDPGEELLLQIGGTEKLLAALRSLPFTAAELQTTIEMLLNRQQEAGAGSADSEWMERGGRLDPIGALRKQLSDKEKALAEELEEKQVYQNKLRTLGAEMAAERTRAASARKQLEESLARQANELQHLTVRLQQAADQHSAELAALRAQHKSALQQQVQQQGPSDEHLRQLQRLQEEKSQLEARYASAQQTTQEIGARVQQLEEVIRHREAQSTAQQHEVVQLREALQATALETRARLEETERTKQLLEDRITTVDRELLMERSIAAQKEAEVRQELQRLCLENQSLHLQLSSTSETRRDDDLKWEQLLREKEKASAEAQKELERLNAVLAQQSEAVKAKDEELEEQRKKNNELRDKNYKAMDALAAAEKALLESKKAAAAASSKQQVIDPSEVHRSILAGLQRVFPDLNSDPATPSASFAESLASQLTESIQRHQTEQSKAAAQVQHYKTVLSQTEELLHRLQTRVEDEEAGWKARLTQQESDLTTVRQERDFWMDQCQKQQQQDEVDSSLQGRIESLSVEKERILQEADRERMAAKDLSSQLEELRASLAEERQTVQHLKEQLEQAKGGVMPVKSVGSPAAATTNGNGANGNGTAAETESPVDEQQAASHFAS